MAKKQEHTAHLPICLHEFKLCVLLQNIFLLDKGARWEVLLYKGCEGRQGPSQKTKHWKTKVVCSEVTWPLEAGVAISLRGTWLPNKASRMRTMKIHSLYRVTSHLEGVWLPRIFFLTSNTRKWGWLNLSGISYWCVRTSKCTSFWVLGTWDMSI